MRDGRIARHGLAKKRPPQRILRARHLALDAAMLVSESYFEMKHLFAVADEAECARLDDAGMDRSDIDLVQRAAAHLVERIGVHSGILVASVPRKAQGLAPRVAVETYPVELVHLTLEDMERRMNGRERRHALLGVVVGNERRYHDRRLPIVEQQQEEAQPLGGLGGEVVSRVVALVAHTLREIVIEVDIVDRRYIFECNRRCGVACYRVVIVSIARLRASGCHRPRTIAPKSRIMAE